MDENRKLFKLISEFSAEEFETCMAAAGVDLPKLKHITMKLYSELPETARTRAAVMAQILAARGLTKAEKLMKQFRFQVYEDLKTVQQEILEVSRKPMTYEEMVLYVKKVHKLKLKPSDLQKLVVELDAERAKEHYIEELMDMAESAESSTKLSAKIRARLNLHLPPKTLVELGVISEEDLPIRGKRKKEDAAAEQADEVDEDITELEDDSDDELVEETDTDTDAEEDEDSAVETPPSSMFDKIR